MKKQKELALIANVVKYENGILENFEPVGDQFVVEIPNVEVKTKNGIIKTDKQIAEEMEKLIGEYFQVVAVGPECKYVKLGDNVFMIPPTKVVSFKANEEISKNNSEPEIISKRFAIFKEYVVLGKLQVSE